MIPDWTPCRYHPCFLRQIRLLRHLKLKRGILFQRHQHDEEPTSNNVQSLDELMQLWHQRDDTERHLNTAVGTNNHNVKYSVHTGRNKRLSTANKTQNVLH